MQKTFNGKVVSIKQQKTAVIVLTRKVAHPLYKKLLTLTKKLQADTAGKEIALGDEVTIAETRPMSKTKNFKIVEVLKHGTA